MRINTTGKKEYRDRLYRDAAQSLKVGTKSEAIDRSCMHLTQDIDAKREALEYLAGELPPRKLARVADMLSTDQVALSVDVTTVVETE